MRGEDNLRAPDADGSARFRGERGKERFRGDNRRRGQSGASCGSARGVYDAARHRAATVAVNGADNAALLAVQMLAVKYDGLKKKLAEYKEDMRRKVVEDDLALQKELSAQ